MGCVGSLDESCPSPTLIEVFKKGVSFSLLAIVWRVSMSRYDWSQNLKSELISYHYEIVFVDK